MLVLKGLLETLIPKIDFFNKLFKNCFSYIAPILGIKLDNEEIREANINLQNKGKIEIMDKEEYTTQKTHLKDNVVETENQPTTPTNT